MSYGAGTLPDEPDPACGLLKQPPPPELTRVRAAIEHFAATPPTPRHPADLGDDLVGLRHCIDLLELQFAQRAAEFAATDQYEQAGSLSPETWIRHACHMSGVAAAGAVRTGEQAHALPESTTALREGRIGFAHLSMLARTAEAVTADARGAATGPHFDERPLLELAQEHSVSRFRHDCAHARHAADAPGFLAAHVSDTELGALELVPVDRGVMLHGVLDEVGGAALRTALEPLAGKSGPDDTRPRSKRLADALVELAHHGLDSGVLPSQAGQRPHLQVTATVDTLVGAHGAPAGELVFANPVPAATVQRLACDASVTRVLMDAKSAIIDVGRARRIPSAATRRALIARDKGCAWPACERPPSWTAAHHLHHWAHGGRTDLKNLALLCHRHHFMVHERGWRVLRAHDGRLLAVPPLQGSAVPPPAPLRADLSRTQRLWGEVGAARATTPECSLGESSDAAPTHATVAQ